MTDNISYEQEQELSEIAEVIESAIRNLDIARDEFQHAITLIENRAEVNRWQLVIVELDAARHAYLRTLYLISLTMFGKRHEVQKEIERVSGQRREANVTKSDHS